MKVCRYNTKKVNKLSKSSQNFSKKKIEFIFKILVFSTDFESPTNSKLVSIHCSNTSLQHKKFHMPNFNIQLTLFLREVYRGA